MEANRSKFWMGLGLGSIIGVIAYRFSCSSKGQLQCPADRKTSLPTDRR